MRTGTRHPHPRNISNTSFPRPRCFTDFGSPFVIFTGYRIASASGTSAFFAAE